MPTEHVDTTAGTDASYQHLTRHWRGHSGLTAREERMAALWLGIDERGELTERPTLDEIAASEATSRASAARIVRYALVKLLLMHRAVQRSPEDE